MTAGPSPIGEATQAVRAELARVDAKAATLLALASTALTLTVAVLARTRLPLAAVFTGWTTAAVILAAVTALAAAIRPNLTGGYGFVRYARAGVTKTRDEFGRLALDTYGEHERREAEVLVALSQSAYRKYRRVRAGVDLLLAGLTGIAVTAALTALG